MGAWRHLVRMRLEQSLPSGGRAISRRSGSTRPGKEAATPMVRWLVLWCTYTGAPWLVTWGSGRGAGITPVFDAPAAPLDRAPIP